MLDGYLLLKSLESYRSELSIIIAKKNPDTNRTGIITKLNQTYKI